MFLGVFVHPNNLGSVTMVPEASLQTLAMYHAKLNRSISFTLWVMTVPLGYFCSSSSSWKISRLQTKNIQKRLKMISKKSPVEIQHAVVK